MTPRCALAALVVATTACTPPPPPLPEHPNFVVVDIDSMREDRLDKAYDGTWVMPTVRALAARGVRFTQATTQGGWTLPALTTLLSGRHPVALDVTAPNSTLFPSDARRVQEILGIYGYHTAAIWSDGVPTDLGFVGKGMAFHGMRTLRIASPSDDLTPFEAWLATGPTEPYLLFVHEFDAHVPSFTLADSIPPRFGEQDTASAHIRWTDLLHELTPSLGRERAIAEVAARYDSGLARYDDVIAALLQRLEEAGLMERTIVVVTSNHGEELAEHIDGVNHGTLYDTVLRIPLVVAGPGIGPSGATIDRPVQLMDIAPTLLDLAHIPIDQTMEGVSLAPALTAGDVSALPVDRPSWTLTSARAAAVRVNGRKLMLLDTDEKMLAAGGVVASDAPPRFEYYDLTTDPGEQHDLFATEPERAMDLVDPLYAFLARQAEVADRSKGFHVNPRLRSVLRERGYWNVAGGTDDAVPAGPRQEPPPEAPAP